MIQLVPTQHPSKTVLEVGFNPDSKGGRGELHVQFHDGQGTPTSRGYYKDCPRSLFNALQRDRKPGSIINSQLKNRFEWVAIARDGEAPEIAEARANPDLTLPDILVIPKEVPNESIQEYIDLQRRLTVKEGLF